MDTRNDNDRSPAARGLAYRPQWTTFLPESMNERDVWKASERLDLLFELLPKRIQERRRESHLRSLTTDFMDYLTRSDTVCDAEAHRVARAVLAVFRVITSIEVLYGRPIDSKINSHPLFREIERLFDNSERGFDGAEFTLYTAGQIKEHTGTDVTFVDEKPNELSPDLRIADLCYVECKDLAPASTDSVRSGMLEHLSKADRQIAAAQGNSPLLAGGVALDLPLELFRSYTIESSPAARSAYEIVSLTLSVPGHIDFIILSISGCEVTAAEVGFPYRICVFARQLLPSAITTRLLGRLCSHVYLVPDRPPEELAPMKVCGP